PATKSTCDCSRTHRHSHTVIDPITQIRPSHLAPLNDAKGRRYVARTTNTARPTMHCHRVGIVYVNLGLQARALAPLSAASSPEVKVYLSLLSLSPVSLSPVSLSCLSLSPVSLSHVSLSPVSLSPVSLSLS